MSKPPYIAVRLHHPSGWFSIGIADGPPGQLSLRHGASFCDYRSMDQADIDRLRELVETAQRMLEGAG